MGTGNPRAGCLVLLGALLLAAGAGGCSTSKQAAWTDGYLKREDFGEMTVSMELQTSEAGGVLEIDQALVDRMSAGTVGSGRVRVSYPEGMRRTATECARLVGAGLARAERDLGMSAALPVRLVLVPTERTPGVVRARYHITADEFTVPVVVAAGEGDAVAALSGPFGSLLMVMHELFELTLVMPWAAPTALPDGQVGMFRKSKNYTRWFRDGLASYAAYLVMGGVEEASGGRWPEGNELGDLVYPDPLTALSVVGGDLLEWHQFSPSRKNGPNYSGSFGVFLAIEQQFGRSAVREIIARVGGLEFPDGQAIEAGCSDVLGVPFGDWVRGYSFPPVASEVGLVMRQAGGGAAVTVDGRRVATPFDLELAVGRSMAAGRPVRLTIAGGEPRVEAALDIYPRSAAPAL